MAPLIDLPSFQDELSFMSSLRTIAPGASNELGASSKSPKARRKHLKAYFRKMRNISASRLDNPSKTPRLRGDIEPLKLGQRIVFRSQGQVPVKSLVALHRLIKNDSIRASEIAAIMSHGKPTRKGNTAFLCMIRNLFEERLKTTVQLTGIFPPDPELTRPTQELFEQFYQVHGTPNDAESELLQEVGYVDAEIVDAWFTLKTFRLRAWQTFFQTYKLSRYQDAAKWILLGDQESDYESSSEL